MSAGMGPHGFTLRQLQYVLAVAETGGFRKAAERCHVAQPSLSAQVAQLEDALGVVLFERGRRVLVTEAGEAVLVRVRRLLAEADDLETFARGLGDPLDGTLRLGVIPTIAPYWLPEVVPALEQAHPKLRAFWREDKTEVLVRAIEEGNLDAAIVAREADLGELVQDELGSDAFLLAVAPDDPLAKGKRPLDLAALEDRTMLLLDDGHCFGDQSRGLCARVGARELDFRATSLGTLVQMVRGLHAITFLPAMAASAEGASSGLKLRRLRNAPRRTVVLVWRRSSPLGDGLRRLADSLRGVFPRGVETKV